MAVIGGFLFSILWEASSRYVLPYVVYMIPLAAMGIYRLVKISDRRRALEEENSAVEDNMHFKRKTA